MIIRRHIGKLIELDSEKKIVMLDQDKHYRKIDFDQKEHRLEEYERLLNTMVSVIVHDDGSKPERGAELGIKITPVIENAGEWVSVS